VLRKKASLDLTKCTLALGRPYLKGGKRRKGYKGERDEGVTRFIFRGTPPPYDLDKDILGTKYTIISLQS